MLHSIVKCTKVYIYSNIFFLQNHVFFGLQFLHSIDFYNLRDNHEEDKYMKENKAQSGIINKGKIRIYSITQ
jgi:hypothetical protein